MIYGMPTLIEQNSLIDSVKLCKELALSFVELNMNLPQYQLNQLEQLEYFRKIKNQYDVFYTIHLDENLNVCDFNPFVAKAYIETVHKTIQIAKALESPVLNMHMNHGVYFTLPDRKVFLFEQYKDKYLEQIVKFREMCEEECGNTSIKICIENTDGYYGFEKEAIELLLKSKVFALTWDIGHSNACENVDEVFLMSQEEHLSHFHIHDGRGTSNHMVLGSGTIDIRQRLNIARKHSCRCVIETKTEEALKESVQWLKIQNLI